MSQRGARVLYVGLDGKTRRMTRNTKCPDNQSLVLLGEGGGVVITSVKRWQS